MEGLQNDNNLDSHSDNVENLHKYAQETAEEALEGQFDTIDHQLPQVTQEILARFHEMGSKSVGELTDEEIEYLISGVRSEPTN